MYLRNCMDTIMILVGITLALLLSETQLVHSLCPETAGEAELLAKNCLKSVGLSMEPSAGGGSSGEADRLEQYCRDGTLNQALACVENILQECAEQNPKVGDMLSKSVSISKLRNGFDYMCDNIDILAAKATCIELQTASITQCVQTETKKFQAKIQASRENGDFHSDDVWSLSCGFMDRVFHCQDMFYRKNCGTKVADVLANFMQSVKPPVCANYGSGGKNIRLTPVLTFIGLCLSLLSFL